MALRSRDDVRQFHRVVRSTNRFDAPNDRGFFWTSTPGSRCSPTRMPAAPLPCHPRKTRRRLRDGMLVDTGTSDRIAVREACPRMACGLKVPGTL